MRRRNLILSGAFFALTFLSIQPVLAADYKESRKQFITGKYAECLESTRTAIVNGDLDKQWWALMVESMMALGKYEQAAQEIDIALIRHPISLHLLKLGYTANLYCGRQKQASDLLGKIYRYGGTLEIGFWDPQDLVALGESLLLLRTEPRLVMEQIFNRALRIDPDCREAYLAIISLALDKQDFELAANQARKALEKFGDDPDMHFSLARAFYYSDRSEMIKSIDAALFVNPNHVPSLLLLAEHQIDCEDYESAEKTLDKVISVNSMNPEAWAYRCILAYIENDPNSAGQARTNALKSWPANPKVDYLIGRKLSQKYRFEEGAACQRRALMFDPGYLPAKIQLAQDLLRLGNEQEGWKLANEVHSEDEYNIEAYNLANLHDHMSGYETIHTDDFIVRMNKHEAAVYGDLVIDLLKQAKINLCKKYGLELNQPTVVELFYEQQDFAVRTFGIPGGDGFLGVCFGNVITANSPKAERQHNWQSTLWHEFCHVVTLNMTGNKMPRWLSEGISVYEEMQRDPKWGQQMNPEYRKMILEGELTPISELSSAFLSPKTPMHLQFAYYESMLVVEFLVKNYGYDALRAILGDLAIGEQINDAISKHAAPIKEIDREFKAFVLDRAENLASDVDWEQPDEGQFDFTNQQSLAAWLQKHPNSFWALTLYAKALIADKKYEQAKEPLEKVISLYPEYTDSDNGYLLLAQVHRNLDETEQERQVLDKLATISADSVYAYGRLMEIAVEKQNWQQVVDNGEKYLAVFPMLSNLQWQLGLAYQELGRNEQAIKSYKRLLLLDPIDPADVYYRLGSLLENEDPAEAKRYVLEALAEAPRFREAHKLLLRLVGNSQSGEPVSSIEPVDAQGKLLTMQKGSQ